MTPARPCAICRSAVAPPGWRTCRNVACGQAYRIHLTQEKPVCLACFRPLLGISVLYGRYCPRPECRPPVRGSGGASRECEVCSGPFVPETAIGGTCGFHECVAVAPVLSTIRRRRREAAEFEDRVRSVHRRLAGGRSRIPAGRTPQALPLAVIPFFTAKPSPTSGRRLGEFRDHLDRVLREATEGRGKRASLPPTDGDGDPPGASDSTPGNDALMRTLCSMCRGYCCRTGQTHAYLKASDLRRYMDEHPDERPREVLEKYLARLPSRTFGSSCVYHAAAGCSLPRSMRSNVCNKFFCGGLAKLRRAFPDRDMEPVLTLSHAGGRVVRACVVDGKGQEDLEVPEENGPGERDDPRVGATSSRRGC